MFVRESHQACFNFQGDFSETIQALRALCMWVTVQ